MGTTIMNQVKLTNITKTFGRNFLGRRKHAVHNFTCNWEMGKIHGLVGSNGSGKSTILRIIAGISKPDNGSVETPLTYGPLGFKYSTVIGYLSARGSLQPALTVEENLRFHYLAAGRDPHSANYEINKVITDLGLEPYRTCRPSQLSTGLHQRARIGQILALRPTVLLLDEPTTALDILAKATIFELLKQLCDHRVCIILATHDPYEIQNICDTVTIINQGHLIAHGVTPAILGVQDFGVTLESLAAHLECQTCSA